MGGSKVTAHAYRFVSPYFIIVSRTSFAWDRPNRPEVFTTETSNHARRSGGVVVEISERKLMSFLKAAIQFDYQQHT
jgi:hypothetical protein